MLRSRLPHYALAVAWWLTGFTPFASAGLMDECPWTETSEDGRFLLVMLQRDKEFCDFDENDLSLLEKYSESGVYLNNGSRELLWCIPYHPHCYEIYFSIDGQHIIFAEESTDHSISNILIGAHLYFYHRDTKHQLWQEHEITQGWMVKVIMDYLLDRKRIEWENATFDASQQTYTVKTSQAEEFVFDIHTGQKIHSVSMWNKSVAVFLIFTPLLVGVSRRILDERPETSSKPTQRKWQISVGELMLFVTTVGILAAISLVSWRLTGGILGLALLGGALAFLMARKRRAWFTGGLLSVYGLVIGLLIFAVACEPLLWAGRLGSYYDGLELMCICSMLSFLAGSLFAGWLERQSVQNR